MKLTMEKIEKAAEVLKGVIKETPLIESEFFSGETGNNIFIKPENLQVTGSFKIRGAYNKICSLDDEQKKRGLTSSSAGNHAQGVAFGALKENVEATIVMPAFTPLIKVEATRSFGAQVVLHGDYYDQAYAEARRLEKEKGYTFIHPFDDMEVIAGQGTIGLEILSELPGCDIILVPVGGGGLISGIALAAKSIKPDIRVIGVEPEGAAAMKMSMKAGRVVELDSVSTIADGVAVKRPGDFTFDIVKDYVDDIITVSDFDLMESFLLLLEREKLIAENAAVLSLAGAKKLDCLGKNIVSVVSGGNIDVMTISAMIDRGLLNRGRIFCFSVELPDKPGELLQISTILASVGANVVKLDHDQFKNVHRFMQVHLEVTVETNGYEHIKTIKNALASAGYDIKQVY